jgi:hypothetical protein
MEELVVVAHFIVGILFWHLLGVRIDGTLPRIKSGTPKALVMLTCSVPTHEACNYSTSDTGWFPHSRVVLVVSWIVTLC